MGLYSIDKQADISYIASMAIELPFSLDEQFVVLREVKAGGFGIVYGGWDENLNLPVALKEIHPELLRQETALAAFQAEAQLIARLDHPGICRLYTLKRWRGRVFMIMEYIDGGDLRHLQLYLKDHDRALSAKAVLYIVRQVAKALHYAHVRSDPTTGAPLHLVHRDIAPSNFMISRMGSVKLIDFGIARVKGVLRPETMGGIIKGRPQYMSPEQIHSPETVDPRSDIYSLAIVFLDMLTGHSVYGKTTNEYELMDRVRARRFDLPAYFADHNLNPVLRPAVESALKMAAVERTATARDFVAQLEPFAQAIGFSDESAEAELKQLAQEAFPASDLQRELQRFNDARRDAMTRTLEVPVPTPARPVSSAEVSREVTASDVPDIQRMPERSGLGPVGWIIGSIFALAIGVFVYWTTVYKPAAERKLAQLDSVRVSDSLIAARAKADSIANIPAAITDTADSAQTAQRQADSLIAAKGVQDSLLALSTETKKADKPTEEKTKPKVDPADQPVLKKSTPTATSGGFRVISTADAELLVDGVSYGTVRALDAKELNLDQTEHNFEFVMKRSDGCRISRSFRRTATPGGEFRPEGLIFQSITFTDPPRNGQKILIEPMDNSIRIVSPGCNEIQSKQPYLTFAGRYRITLRVPGYADEVKEFTLSPGKNMTGAFR